VQATNELIAATATPPGIGGVSVIRISGSDMAAFAKKILSISTLPPPRVATRTAFVNSNHQPLDDGICLYFQAPHSFTGQDVLELHGHGGSAVVRSVLTRCLELGARLAEPGEFTLRAHLNGKLDLAQAEALADLINANSAAAARAAVHSLSGDFSKRAQGLSEKLAKLRADMEALMDFADEEISTNEAPTHRLAELLEDASNFLEQCEQGTRLSTGMTAAIIGHPNAGKSSLLNQLCRENAAIVTSIPGTTRDPVFRDIEANGLTLRIVDTAGLRDSTNVIEREGITRAHAEAEKADLVLLIDDGKGVPEITVSGTLLRVRNKIDLDEMLPDVRDGVVYLSAKTGTGIEALRTEIARIGSITEVSAPFSARIRHVDALRQSVAHLRQSHANAAQMEVAAAWLASAQRTLESLTGAFDDEDLLGEIFSRFCVGK
jgi:tRNA modification GTPase